LYPGCIASDLHLLKNRPNLEALKSADFRAVFQGITGQKPYKKSLKSKNTASFFQAFSR